MKESSFLMINYQNRWLNLDPLCSFQSQKYFHQLWIFVHFVHFKKTYSTIRRSVTALLSPACVTSIETNSHWSKIALSGLNYKTTNL